MAEWLRDEDGSYVADLSCGRARLVKQDGGTKGWGIFINDKPVTMENTLREAQHQAERYAAKLDEAVTKLVGILQGEKPQMLSRVSLTDQGISNAVIDEAARRNRVAVTGNMSIDSVILLHE